MEHKNTWYRFVIAQLNRRRYWRWALLQQRLNLIGDFQLLAMVKWKFVSIDP